MSIQFYTGSAQDLYTTPSKFTGAPAYVTLLKSTYEFDASHSLDDVLQYASGDSTLLTSKVLYTSGTNKIFDAGDVQLYAPENIQVKYILIYYTDASILRPACIIHTSNYRDWETIYSKYRPRNSRSCADSAPGGSRSDNCWWYENQNEIGRAHG